MEEGVPCLVRVGHGVKKYTILRLQKDQVTMGRSRQATYMLPSQTISRWHAVISRLRGTTWSLLDANSLNGICVNGHPIKPFSPYTLHDGDLIQFAACDSRGAEYQYRFYTSCHDRKECNYSVQTISQDHSKLSSINPSLYDERVVTSKNRKHELIKRKFSETLTKGTVARLHTVKAQEDFLSTLLKFTEKKLQCAVCRKLLVQATALNCSHMFCKLCILKWMQSNNRCPTCRQFITSVIHIVALDSCLNEIAEQLNERGKQQRADIIHLRKGEKRRYRDTVNDHLSGLRVERKERLAVSACLIRTTARLASLKLAAASTERITLTDSVVTAQTSLIKRVKKHVKLTVCPRRQQTKHSPLPAKTGDELSSTAVVGEKALKKATALKQTAVFRKVQRVAGKAVNAARTAMDEIASVTTEDALAMGKAAAIQSVCGSVTHNIRNSRLSGSCSKESFDNSMSSSNGVINENRKANSSGGEE